MFEVIINDGIKVVVTKSFGLPSGFYLGVFISENKGLSNETTGMMGNYEIPRKHPENNTRDTIEILGQNNVMQSYKLFYLCL